jgi:serine/threonine-protein kinase
VEAPPPPSKSGGLGGLVAVLLALVALTAGGWAVAFGPLKHHAQGWLDSQAQEPVVDHGPRPIAIAGGEEASDKPAWLLAKERQRAELAAERARQAEIEAAANDPERQKLLEEIQAQLQQLDALEAEQRQLKIDARLGKAAGEANAQKIGDLQKQIDALKAMVEEKQARSKAKRPASGQGPGEGEVEVVRDSKSAKAADVGFLTLRTLNPSSTAVFLEGTALGSTPLVKVPLDVGVHKLRVVDGDSKNRWLSVTIGSGKTLDLRAVDVTSLPLAP